LHYQAKLDPRSNRISGVEALLRWRHPEFGMVALTRLIPLAQETGLIVPIGKWVLREAFQQNVAWQREGLPAICIAVNLSARQIAEDDFVDELRRVLQDTGLAPDLLELELTENVVMRDIERAARVFGAIKALGVRIAIDDFGGGLSSLAYLKRFPIDTLKLDRSFIRDVADSSESRAIAEVLIAPGKTLSMRVVGEGVETHEQQTLPEAAGLDRENARTRNRIEVGSSARSFISYEQWQWQPWH
jgi:EAL domain-containing protein (putative c-di-GMP-specific phosphodiesterase class I)